MSEDWAIRIVVPIAAGIAALAWHTLATDAVLYVYPWRLRSLRETTKTATAGPVLRCGGAGATRRSMLCGHAGAAPAWAKGLLSRLKDSSRRKQVERAFPEVIDLMLVCVNAGMNLYSALRYVAHITRGPLGDGLKRVVYAASTGYSLREALEEELCGPHSSPSLKFFAATLGYSYARGNPVSEVLRAQAWMTRQQRKQAMEALVRSMPTKIVVCSIVFFLPVILVMTVLPGVLMFLGSSW